MNADYIVRTNDAEVMVENFTPDESESRKSVVESYGQLLNDIKKEKQ